MVGCQKYQEAVYLFEVQGFVWKLIAKQVSTKVLKLDQRGYLKAAAFS